MAGISIQMLTGQNGILKRAQESSEKTKIAELVETVQMEIYDKQTEQKGSLEAKDLYDILGEYFNNVPDLDSWESFPDNFTEKLESTEDSKIKVGIEEIYKGTLGNSKPEEPSEFNPEKIEIGEAIRTGNYGDLVEGYNVKTSEYQAGKWRLFYQDSNYTYLITDELVGNYVLSDEFADKGYTEVGTIGKKLNAKLLQEKGETFFTYDISKGNGGNENIKSTAWLTDIDVWSKYKNNDAIYAIGSPTLDLFAKSYNTNTNISHKDYESDKIILTAAELGYEGGLNGEHGLDINDSHSIYNIGNNGWWLASPGNECTRYGSAGNKIWGWGECLMRCDGEYIISGGDTYGGVYDALPVRPIVCIQTPVFENGVKSGKYQLKDE